MVLLVLDQLVVELVLDLLVLLLLVLVEGVLQAWALVEEVLLVLLVLLQLVVDLALDLLVLLLLLAQNVLLDLLVLTPLSLNGASHSGDLQARLKLGYTSSSTRV